MSYLSQLTAGKINGATFLAKSVGYLKSKLGVTVGDEAVTAVETATHKLADDVEKLVVDYLASHAPGLPAVIGTAAATSVVNLIDTAIAGAANVIRENN